jgi:D-alanyl-D-alanine carboxypeptidase/D-alanyl-D-alanine-endopeptidase (penicillin-binding protein 4)
LRFSRLVIFAAIVAVLAAAGAVYVTTRPGSTSHQTGTTPPVVVPDVLRSLASSSVPDAAAVAAALRAGSHDPALGTIAAVVVDARTGTELFARHANRSVAPASTAKLLTAAAALTRLADAEPLTTGVVRSGDTLYLVGGGDVTLAARPQPGYPHVATLTELAAKTAAAVPSGAALQLRYDASGWSGPDLAPGWSPGYLSAGNVSRLSPLEVDEGRLSKGATAPRAADPSRQAAREFRRALRTSGVQVQGHVRPGVAPASGLGIAAVQSPPIPALVTRMLTESDNDLAEALGRLVARKAGRPATFAGAAAAVTAAVRDLGVPTRGVRLYDASGLSRDDRVTPRALVALLRLVTGADSALAPMAAALPVAGFTGTLADRYRDGTTDDGAGLVRAKTGTLAGVSALAGQVVDADGRLLVFAFLADHVPLPDPAEQALDRLATVLSGCGCRAPT